MKFFKWLSNQFEPGPIGSLLPKQQEDTNKNEPGFFHLIFLAIFGLAFLILIVCGIYGLERNDQLTASIVFIIYLLFSFVLSPEPSYDNLGWFGGLINNPFRISDNINRFILFLYLLLLPGKFIIFGTKAVVILIRHFKNKR